MPRFDELKSVSRVAETRVLRRLAAEAEVARAAARLADLHRTRAEQSDALAEHERGWAASLAGSAFDLALRDHWARSVTDSEERLGRTDMEIAHAREAVEAAREALRVALAKADAAETIRHQALRKVRRWLDEAALDEAADRTSRSWRQP